MEYISLLLIVIFVSLQNICAKEYSKKTSEGALMFAAITVFFATIVFVISFIAEGGRFEFTGKTLNYAILFAISYGGATVGSIYAIKYGPLSLTSLLTSSSLIVPTFYGIAVLGEETGAFLYIGLILLLAALVLVNLEGKNDKKITLKWVLFIIMAFIGNGVCSIVQKMQQVNQAGMYKNEFMIVSLLIVCVATLILSLIFEKNPLKNFKKGIVTGGARGVANGIVNLLVISLALTLPASLMFPVISGGGIALTSIIALTAYREKLSANQILGLILGIASVIFLNI